MYGGHITDDWDRRLCVSYLEELMQPELVDGELLLAPGKGHLTERFDQKQAHDAILKGSQHRRTRIWPVITRTSTKRCPRNRLTCTACIQTRKWVS